MICCAHVDFYHSFRIDSIFFSVRMYSSAVLREPCEDANHQPIVYGGTIGSFTRMSLALSPPPPPQRREKMASQATNALVKNRERVLIMEEHLKNVRQEVGHTNALMAAKKKEIATEEHLCALAAREAGRCDPYRPLCRLFMYRTIRLSHTWKYTRTGTSEGACYSCSINTWSKIVTVL